MNCLNGKGALASGHVGVRCGVVHPPSQLPSFWDEDPYMIYMQHVEVFDGVCYIVCPIMRVIGHVGGL